MSVKILQRHGGSWQCWYYDREHKRKAITLKIDGRNPKDLKEAEKARDIMLPDIMALDAMRTHEQAVVALASARKLIKSLEHKPSDMWQIFEQSHRDMSARRKYQVRLAYDRFMTYCDSHGITDMSMVTREIVMAWLDEVSKGFSNRTWNGNLGDIRMVFSASWRALGLDEEPTATIKKKPKQTISRQPYAKTDVDDVLEKLDKGLCIPYHYKTHGKVVVVNRPFHIPYNIIEVKAAILLAAYCGMRLADAVSARYEQYDGEFLHYTPSKTRKSTDEVVVPVVHKGLKKILEHGEGFVTPSLKALHDKSDSMCSRFFIRIFRACGYQTTIECEGRRRASIGGSHAMRHSYITWAIEDGVPIDVVSTCAGHKSILQTAIYNHISAKRKASELAKIIGEHVF